MRTFKYIHSLSYCSLGLIDRYFGDATICVFDIETLGLNPSTSEIVLAGLMTVDSNGHCELTQYFLDTLDDEALLLTILKDELNKYDLILTYNGRHFDLPFIKKRATILGIDEYEIIPYNLDLYLVINGHSMFKKVLPNLKQSSIEDYMGLGTDRKDEISGKESVQLYYDYLLCSDKINKEGLQKKILLHNHDDIMQLYRILPVIKQTDFHKAMNALGFPIKRINDWPKLTIRSSKVNTNGLTIEGSYSGKGLSYMSFVTSEEPYECTFSTDKSFRFVFPVEKYKSSIFINTFELLGNPNDFSKYGSYVNGYLILIEENKKNFLEINMITRKLLEKFLNEHSV